MTLLYDEHARFRQALLSTSQASIQNTRETPVELLHEYYYAFNGVAANGSLDQIQRLAKLPMVAGFSLERTFQVSLHESVKQIQADRVKKELGYDGAGVLVGIIDTGIDYQHPALGGGYGPGFRVEGGYDFVNDDADPMDDMGHGTHVAGIVAANSDELTGVAPGARLLAVKVLSEQGFGSESNILAAIDYCLDPDGDPTTDDGVDIINMSFGAPPIANDPLIVAAENATRAGVLCVAAAGNAGELGPGGSGFETIGSPAAGESVLAVGSCDAKFVRSLFSSKGPTANTSLIKPDVLAPGEQITSAWPNKATNTLDGTSMAAPHAAGAAALLKQQHPEWSPQQLKAALVNSGDHIDPAESPYAIGNGCINAWTAATLTFAASPGILNFSPVELSQSIWRDTLSFTLHNHGSVARTIALAVESPNPGLQVNLSSFLLTLAPASDQTINAVLQASSSVPIKRDYPFGYTGSILCISGADSIRVPYGVIKSNVMAIDFDFSPSRYVIFSPDLNDYRFFQPKAGMKSYTHRLPTGIYNVFALFEEQVVQQDTFFYYYAVEQQDIKNSGFHKIFISRHEAQWPAYDPINNVPGVSSAEDIIYLGFGFAVMRPGYNDYVVMLSDDFYRCNVFVSTLSDYIRVESNIIAGPENDPILLNPYIFGVKSAADVQLNFSSSDFERFFVRVDPCQKEAFYHGMEASFGSTLYSIPGIDSSLPGASSSYHSYNIGYLFLNQIPNSLRFPKSATDIGLPFFRHFKLGSCDASHDWTFYYDWVGKFCMQKDGLLLCFDSPISRSFADNMTRNFYADPGDTLVFSRLNNVLIPVFWVNPAYTPQGSTISIDNTYNRIGFDFRGVVDQNGFYSMWSADKMYSCMLLDNGVKSAPTFSDTYNPITYYSVQESSFYRLFGNTITYSLLGQEGLTTFDFSGGFHGGIPCIDLFQVQADGKPTHFVQKDQNGLVRFIPWDWSDDITNVTLALMPANGEKIVLTTRKIEREYQAVIPDTLPHEYIDVIALVKDAAGSQLDVRMLPGFFFGEAKSERTFHGRLLVDSYELLNPEQRPFGAGDTLLFALKVKGFGNEKLENVIVDFPPQNGLIKLGDTSKTLAQLSPGDSVEMEIPFLLTSKPSGDDRIDYTITMQWISNGKQFRRSFDMYIYTDFPTGVAQSNNEPPLLFQVRNNYPNPFNNETILEFSIPETGRMTIDIFNISGQHVRTLVDRDMPAGDHQQRWDGLDDFYNPVSSGLYLYRIRFGEKQQFGKMVVQR